MSIGIDAPQLGFDGAEALVHPIEAYGNPFEAGAQFAGQVLEASHHDLLQQTVSLGDHPLDLWVLVFVVVRL
ncbi:MAG TPA: hypothetical protein VFB50_17470 [Chloroflexota bacterium]|nr:hypothetical protein [Chloroflexota bacterium]